MVQRWRSSSKLPTWREDHTGPGLRVEELPARLCDGRGTLESMGWAAWCLGWALCFCRRGAPSPLALLWQCECDHICTCHAPSDLSRESGFRANLPTYVSVHYHSRQQRRLRGPLSQLVPLTLDYHHRSGEEVHILTTRAPG